MSDSGRQIGHCWFCHAPSGSHAPGCELVASQAASDQWPREGDCHHFRPAKGCPECIAFDLNMKAWQEQQAALNQPATVAEQEVAKKENGS